ncbi:hypothetical protein QC823_11800 [Halomonas vilamensis]|uniref:Uncharacterized protein n=1 Tax=Vreelandella vilamensis TaxID=531309 RepID=A0ABU1H824_9GAMM|nr:hypothetical protein [Halomonas vilamensis]MDR5899668.1 hypothetical protein [Halomonas vilamensis]
MQSKYKIRLLRGNLLAVAIVLALWTPAAPPKAALLLWLSVGWLVMTAILLDFSHRRPRGVPWQLLPGALLVGLIAVAPERHSLLIWAWAALFMLPQMRWVAAFNVSGMALSLVLIAPQLSPPSWWLMALSLGVLSLLALSRARQLTNMNGTIRQRLRLIPGFNLWAREQLLRDLPTEQTRCEREGIHGELLILQVKRQKLWHVARQLCEQTYYFENVYRLNGTTLATVLLSRSPKEAKGRRERLLAELPDILGHRSVELIEIETDPFDLSNLTRSEPATSVHEAI